MDKRRLARGGPKVTANGHSELTEKGMESPVWLDSALAQEWLRVRGLPAAPAAFESSPRALRDWAADEWAKAEGITNQWGGTHWERLHEDYGIPPAGRARTRARYPASRSSAPF